MDKNRARYLVVFDLGGVLVRLVRGLDHAAEKAGLTLPELDEPRWRQLQALMMDHERGRFDCDHFFQQAAAVSGLSPEQHRALHEAWLCGPYEGVAKLIASLDGRVATACLSNTNDLHWRMMTEGDGSNRLPLERLTWRFASHQLGLVKPDEAIYAHVEQATGLPGSRIVFFDDNEPNVAAARSRGWGGCRIDPQGDPVAQMRQHLSGLNLI